MLYFKRIRLNVGGDYAQFRDVGRGGMKWRRIWSVGGDIVFDINAFRQPASATSTFKLSVYHPANGGVWWAAAVVLRAEQGRSVVVGLAGTAVLTEPKPNRT